MGDRPGYRFFFKKVGKVHKPEDGIYLRLNDKASVVEENVRKTVAKDGHECSSRPSQGSTPNEVGSH